MKRMLLLCTFVTIRLFSMNITQLANSVSSQTLRFDIKKFEESLEQLVDQREQSGHAGRFVLKFTPYPESSFIILGPLKGAYDSLVRTLTVLYELGIISHELTIVPHNTYLVFNGDAVGNAAGSLDSLMLMVTLMKNNPHKVFYLKGEAEREMQGQNTLVKKDLQEKNSAYPNLPRSLSKRISRFFSTLPLALYLTGLRPEKSALRISYFPRSSKEIEESYYPSLFTSTLLNVPHICPYMPTQKQVLNIKATIVSEQRFMSYQQHPGLILVEPDKGSVTWNIFSGPSFTYQREYQFFKDAFILLKIGTSLDDSILELHTADIRTKEPFHLRGSYDLMTGVQRKHITATPRYEFSSLNNSILSVYHEIESLTAQALHLQVLLEARSEG